LAFWLFLGLVISKDPLVGDQLGLILNVLLELFFFVPNDALGCLPQIYNIVLLSSQDRSLLVCHLLKELWN
jgi:hypothetical protein